MKLIALCLTFVLVVFGQFKVPKYEKLVLENGLTVYLMPHTEVPLINVSILINAGAIHDGKHFGTAYLTAEALRFGTQSYTKPAIDEELDFIGANIHTGASLEYTSINAEFAKKDAATVFPILKEMITSPQFDPAEFDKFKTRHLTGLKIEKDQPGQVIGNYFNKFLYGNHEYGNPISGTEESVEKITVDDVRTFYSSSYAPNESAIAVVGDFNTAEMKKTLAEMFKGWQKKMIKRKAVSLPETLDGNRVLLVDKENSLETRFYIGQFGIKQNNPDKVGIDVINTILGGRFTSWLNDELRVNAGLTYGARSGFDSAKESGTFRISTFTKTQTTVEAIDLALEVYERLYKKGIDEKTLESAKNYVKGQFPPRYETAGALAGFLTSMYFYGYDERYINDFIAKVDAIDVNKAKEIVKTYFPKESLQFVLIGKASEIKDKVKKYGALTIKNIQEQGF